MNRNPFESRLLRTAVPAIVLLGAVACSSDEDPTKTRPTASSSRTVAGATTAPTETLSPAPTETAIPAPTPEAIAAAHLENRAFHAANSILYSTVSIDSGVESAHIGQISFLSNKRTDPQGGPVPNFHAAYDAEHKTLLVEVGNTPNPQASEDQMKFDFVRLEFALPQGVNSADKKRAAGKELNEYDFEKLLTKGATLTTAYVQNNDIKPVSQIAEFGADGSVSYSKRNEFADNGENHPATVSELSALSDGFTPTLIKLFKDMTPPPFAG